MKILKLEFENINSLKGKHTVDFQESPFTNSTLFAITGPTGSGKSTLLDVICLALFNRIPRLGNMSPSKNQIGKTGAIITRNQKTAMAAVTYEGKQGVFRSEWKISTARTGSLRDYEMHLTALATDQVIDLKKSEVPEANQQRIGLNYDQFVKSVMLAQGEFSEFLKAKKEVRGDLLEKITGTGIYRQLGKSSFDKFKLENKAIEAQKLRITAIKEQLLEEEHEKSLVEEFKLKGEELKSKQKQIESFKKQLDLKKTIAAKEKEQSEQENQKITAKKNWETFESEYGMPLKQHEKIASEAENLRNWSQLKKESSDLKKEWDSGRKSQEENSAEQESCLENAGILIGAPIASEDLVVALENFRKKINALQEEKRATGQEYTSVKTQLKRELQGIGWQINENKLAENLKDLLDLQKKSEENIAVLKSDLSQLDLKEPEKEQKQLTDKLEMAREAQRKDDEIKKITVDFKTIKSEEDSLAPKIMALPADIDIAKDKAALYQTRLEKFELQQRNELLLASLEQHRHRLEDGEACPLCGALQHPYATDLPEKSNSMEIEIANNRKELKLWSTKLATSEADLKNHKKRFVVVQKQQQELARKLDAGKTEFSGKYKQLIDGTENPDWEAVCQQWKKQIGKIEKYRGEHDNLQTITAGIPILEKLQKIFLKGKKLKQELEDLYRGKDIEVDISEINTRWIRLLQAQKHIGERLSELRTKIATKSDELVALEAKLLELVQQHNFQSIEQAWKALIPESECTALRSKRATIQNKITAATSALELIETQLSEIKKEDSAIKTEELKENLIKTEEVAETLAEECKECSRQLKNHADNLKRLKEITTAIFEKEQEIRKWRLLNELIGDSKGKIFNDFAQDLNLKHLLHLANKRLKKMSDRYLIDQPTADEDDDSLSVIDQEMGGQRRSVKTLSGGETFILSLSMALALSDLASKNVSIKSLFIDEGFGTLDQETLDQTLDTLERLQAESAKTIGIISHVESLKERIATQIQLTRNGQGYSSLEVVPHRQS